MSRFSFSFLILIFVNNYVQIVETPKENALRNRVRYPSRLERTTAAAYHTESNRYSWYILSSTQERGLYLKL